MGTAIIKVDCGTFKSMKSYQTKPSIKQKKAILNMVENGGNVSKAMIQAGYSENTAKTPQKLTGSKGFIALANQLGLTDGMIAQALAEDIKSKPGNRVAELALASKLKGLQVDRSESVTVSDIRVIFG